MKRLVLCLVLFAAMPAFGQQPQDAEIITTGFKISETNGIVYINGEVKNNMPVPIKDLRARIQYYRGRTLIGTDYLDCESFAAKEQQKLSFRSESQRERWNDYKISFFDGNTPLTYRAPR